MPTSYFAAPAPPGWEDYAVLALLAAATILAQIFLQARSRHPDGVHSPPLAWMRAILYFIVVLAVSWLAGVLSVVLHAPLFTPAQAGDPLWLGLTGLCVALVVWGYVIWWPRGTLVYDRKSYPVVQFLYGFAWGACTAQVPLLLWAGLERFGFDRWINAVLVLFLLSGYSQLYQSGWWDIHVSPPHNLRAWNAKKVLFGHMPFLIATLSFLALYGNVAIFVLLHATAMACSAVAMRFPPFWEKDGPPVSRETAIGV
jgi:hypothetical protein